MKDKNINSFGVSFVSSKECGNARYNSATSSVARSSVAIFSRQIADLIIKEVLL